MAFCLNPGIPMSEIYLGRPPFHIIDAMYGHGTTPPPAQEDEPEIRRLTSIGAAYTASGALAPVHWEDDAGNWYEDEAGRTAMPKAYWVQACNPDGTPLSNTDSAEWVFSDGQEHVPCFDDHPYDSSIKIWWGKTDVCRPAISVNDGPETNLEATQLKLFNPDSQEYDIIGYRKYTPGHWVDADGNWVQGEWDEWNIDSQLVGARLEEHEDHIDLIYPYVNGDETTHGNINVSYIMMSDGKNSALVFCGIGSNGDNEIVIGTRAWNNSKEYTGEIPSRTVKFATSSGGHLEHETDVEILSGNVVWDSYNQNGVQVGVQRCISGDVLSNNVIISLSSDANCRCLSVGRYAFINCGNLKSVDLPTVKYIGRQSFQNCSVLTSICVSSAVSVSEYAFAKTRISSIDLPFLRNVPDSMVSQTDISSIDLPSCVIFENFSFNNCFSLEHIYAPNCTTVGAHSFMYDVKLKQISLPNCVELKEDAFWNSCVLSISLPKCTTIAENGFICNPKWVELTQFTRAEIEESADYWKLGSYGSSKNEVSVVAADCEFILNPLEYTQVQARYLNSWAGYRKADNSPISCLTRQVSQSDGRYIVEYMDGSSSVFVSEPVDDPDTVQPVYLSSNEFEIWRSYVPAHVEDQYGKLRKGAFSNWRVSHVGVQDVMDEQDITDILAQFGMTKDTFCYIYGISSFNVKYGNSFSQTYRVNSSGSDENETVRYARFLYPGSSLYTQRYFHVIMTRDYIPDDE